jgi:hypothetical protein
MINKSSGPSSGPTAPTTAAANTLESSTKSSTANDQNDHSIRTENTSSSVKSVPIKKSPQQVEVCLSKKRT